MLLALALACASATGDDEAPGTVADGDTPTGTTTGGTTPTDTPTDDTTTPHELNGTPPEVAIEAPEFVATNQHGELRDRDALLGHPTVLWFYPAAGTGG